MVLSPSRSCTETLPPADHVQRCVYHHLSLSNDQPSRPLVKTWLLVRPVFTIETIALWTIIHCRQSQPFFPIVHKERTSPVPFMSSCRLFSVLSPFLITLELVQQHPGCDLLLWCRGFFLLLQLLTFSLIGRYLSFRIVT